VPKILVTLLNDDGTQNQQSFELEGDLDCLDGIDEAVENFKNAALPKMEQQLLQKAQDRALTQEKKTLSADT
jgi:hypothetical protein